MAADGVSSPRVSKGFSRKLPSLTVGLLTRRRTRHQARAALPVE
jgi:hypothetical protein